MAIIKLAALGQADKATRRAEFDRSMEDQNSPPIIRVFMKNESDQALHKELFLAGR